MRSKHIASSVALAMMFTLLAVITACGNTNTSSAPGGTSNANSTGGGAVPSTTVTLQATASTTTGSAVNVIATTTPISATPTTSGNVVLVVIDDKSITSSLKSFAKNTPYVFIVTNKGASPHDFIISQQAQNTVSTPTTQPSLLIVPADQLHPSATRGFTYRFPDSSSGLRLEFTEQLAGANGQGGVTPLPIEVK